MVDYREIIRLKSLNYGQRTIASSVHSSRNTIREVLELAEKNNIKWPLEDNITNEVLESILYPERVASRTERQIPDYAKIHKELARPGVNLTLLWTEYCIQCKDTGKNPYMYTQFCDLYRKWARATKATMRINHKPGDAMEVDWAGNTLEIVDKYTGDITKAYVFVAVLPCSCYAYAEACLDMKMENWIMCHVHAYSYFGGIARLLISDNLKTGVVTNNRYEVVTTRAYSEMAEYYNTAIIPARVRKPQDKSHAEGTVKYVSTWIIAALRDRKFFSISEVKQAVAEKLEELNNYSFKKREGNRKTAYLMEEKEFMQPLPHEPYELAVWSTSRVPYDYLISDGKNKYSVPFDLIGEDVDIRLTHTTVEVFFHGSRVASHPRRNETIREPIIMKEHMTPEHKKYLNYNESDFRTWATSIGKHTEKVVNHFLTSGKAVEQGFKACASLTKLADTYGHERLEKACERVLSYATEPSIRIISTVLKNKQDKVPMEEKQTDTVYKESRGITRGASYFKKGGASR